MAEPWNDFVPPTTIAQKKIDEWKDALGKIEQECATPAELIDYDETGLQDLLTNAKAPARLQSKLRDHWRSLKGIANSGTSLTQTIIESIEISAVDLSRRIITGVWSTPLKSDLKQWKRFATAEEVAGLVSREDSYRLTESAWEERRQRRELIKKNPQATASDYADKAVNCLVLTQGPPGAGKTAFGNLVLARAATSELQYLRDSIPLGVSFND
eukprot:TRINITY_DN7969_c0_g1_i5.p1 TRINITY_DN7969_c0_g1~~TRINITY_DN7969_c0_g1_i5.p1  ORF type:complete len:214 (+),score=21.98 TRINITY_DN7969_c0_g1_i5:124-765(+)